MRRQLCVFVLALAAAGMAGAGADWPQWRGPDRNGYLDETLALPNSWPKEGPLKLWTSEKVLSAGWGGYGSVSVADGKVFAYCNWKTRVPFPERTLTEQGLKQLGWFPEKPPAELLDKIEQTRLSEARAGVVGNKLGEWMKTWLEQNLTEEQRKKHGGFATRRLRDGKNAMELEVLDKLAAIKGKQFPDQEAFNKWFKDNGLSEKVNKAAMRVVQTYRDVGKDVVFCFDAADGRTLWKFEQAKRAAPRELSGTPCVADGRCYVLGSTGDLYCLDAVKGDLLWKADAGAVHSSPVVADGKAIVLGGRLRAFNVSDGKPAWEQPKVGGGEGSPIVWRGGGRACVIVHNGTVSCVDLTDGKLLWTAPGGGGSTPAAAGDRLVVSTNTKELGLVAYTISPAKAEKAWSLPELGERYACPALRDGHAYVVSNGKAACIVLDSGKVLWTEKVGSSSCSSPALVSDVLVAVLQGGRLAVLRASPEKAEIIGKAALGVTEYTSPAVADGKLYVRLKDAVACFDLAKPAEKSPPEK